MLRTSTNTLIHLPVQAPEIYEAYKAKSGGKEIVEMVFGKILFYFIFFNGIKHFKVVLKFPVCALQFFSFACYFFFFDILAAARWCK